jgi:hypothetical protein
MGWGEGRRWAKEQQEMKPSSTAGNKKKTTMCGGWANGAMNGVAKGNKGNGKGMIIWTGNYRGE